MKKTALPRVPYVSSSDLYYIVTPRRRFVACLSDIFFDVSSCRTVKRHTETVGKKLDHPTLNLHSAY
jgi:hypothetical protein